MQEILELEVCLDSVDASLSVLNGTLIAAGTLHCALELNIELDLWLST